MAPFIPSFLRCRPGPRLFAQMGCGECSQGPARLLPGPSVSLLPAPGHWGTGCWAGAAGLGLEQDQVPCVSQEQAWFPAGPAAWRLGFAKEGFPGSGRVQGPPAARLPRSCPPSGSSSGFVTAGPRGPACSSQVFLWPLAFGSHPSQCLSGQLHGPNPNVAAAHPSNQPLLLSGRRSLPASCLLQGLPTSGPLHLCPLTWTSHPPSLQGWLLLPWRSWFQCPTPVPTHCPVSSLHPLLSI